MNVRADHHTRYCYEKAVSFSPHVVRLYPRPAPHLRVHQQEVSLSIEEANPMPGIDLFGNCITTIFLPGATHEFGVTTRIAMEIRSFNPFNFLVAGHALEIPFRYYPWETKILAPYLAFQEAPITLSFFPFPQKPSASVELLVGLTQAIHHHILYEHREEGAARSAHETLALGHGACRDSAVLLAEVLRQWGIAARLVSGYLCEFDVAPDKRVADGALHAWTEAYLPGAGWIGLDATNGVLCNENFIPLAVGLTPEDIAPVHGIFYHDHPVQSSMHTELTLTLV